MINVRSLASSSKGNCHQLVSGDRFLLLDAGISAKDILKFCNSLTHCDGVLISHSHGDHTKAVKELLRIGVRVYMSEATKQALGMQNERKAIVLKSEEPLRIGEFKVMPFSLEHDVPNLGFLVSDGTDKLVYITDTYFCRYLFKDLTHIMVEVNHSYKILDEKIANGDILPSYKERLMRSHFALENVIDFLKSMDLTSVREIRLLHLSDNNSNADEFREEIEKATGKLVTIADS